MAIYANRRITQQTLAAKAQLSEQKQTASMRKRTRRLPTS